MFIPSHSLTILAGCCLNFNPTQAVYGTRMQGSGKDPAFLLALTWTRCHSLSMRLHGYRALSSCDIEVCQASEFVVKNERATFIFRVSLRQRIFIHVSPRIYESPIHQNRLSA